MIFELYFGKSVHHEPFKKINMFFFDHWTVFSTLIQFIHVLAPRSLWVFFFSEMIIELSGSDDHTEAELVLNTITFAQNGANSSILLDSADESIYD